MPSSEDPVDVGLLSPATEGHDELVTDARIARAMVEAEVALATVSARLGIAPESAANAIKASLRGHHPDAAALARSGVRGGNPVIPLVTELRALVAQTDIAAADWVHRGATSQDILDTALMLVATRAVSAIDASLTDAASTLVGLAEKYRTTVMAARTLTQHSTPTTFGLVAAGWLLAVVDARTALASPLPAQLGGASGTLASFTEMADAAVAAELPSAFAQELGLTAPAAPWHTRRIAITRLGDALATATDALGAIAAEVLILGRTEIAEVAESRGSGRGGSSAMPQKHNPVLSVLIRSAAQRAPGLAAELHRSAASTIDQRADGAWHAEWPALRELIRLTLGAAANASVLLGGLEVDEKRMQRNLAMTGPSIVAERLSLVLGPRLGASRVQELVDHGAAGADLATLLRDEPELHDLDLPSLLDPNGYTGAASQLIDAALAVAERGRP